VYDTAGNPENTEMLQNTTKRYFDQKNVIFSKKRASTTIVFVVNPPMQKQKNLGLVGGGVPAPFKIA
jgi:hypothetical protein